MKYFYKNQSKSWIISTKINQNHKNICIFCINIILYLIDINIYIIINKTFNFLEKYIIDRKKSFFKSRYFLDFRSDPDRNQTDPKHCFKCWT